MDNKERLLLFIVVLIRTALGCPTGFMTHESGCYHFSHDTESWFDAMKACRELDSELAEIKDDIENKFLIAQAKLLNTAYWIALSDILVEGSWIWMNSHTPLNSTRFSDWYPGQPNNYQKDENCAIIRDNGHHTWQWNDYSCHNNEHYICKKSDDLVEVIG